MQMAAVQDSRSEPPWGAGWCRPRSDGSEFVHVMVVGVLSALVVPLLGVTVVVGAGWLLWRRQVRRGLRPSV